MSQMSAQQRIAPAADHEVAGAVTLMNSFAVKPERDEAFHELWSRTSTYFTAQPGFVSLRLHRAVSDDATYRWVNVANWESEAAFRAAHGTEEFSPGGHPAGLGGVPELADALHGGHRGRLKRAGHIGSVPQRQRVAAYAEVRDPAGRVLLVKSTDEIGGKWFLPGGGIAFGEHPVDALHREVLEETGLAIRNPELQTAVSDTVQWRGESVHSIRLIYRAEATEPGQELRHEVGGSTVLAEWVDDADLPGRVLARYAATYLAGAPPADR